jgi:hypothetical protein
MNSAVEAYKENLRRARDLIALADSIAGLTTNAVDVSDCYRAALVQGVSALDHFVHQVVRIGMKEVHTNTRAPTESYLSFKLPMRAARLAVTDPSDTQWLDEVVRDAHSWLSFQQPDKIADAIRLISPVALWDRLAAELNVAKPDLKAELIIVVDRRNKIAHEADIDPTNPPARWPIDAPMVQAALDFLERIGTTIILII